MIEINLIPDVKRELLKAQRVRATVITGSITIGVISLSIVAVLLIYIFAVQTVRSAVADESIKTESQKLTSVEDLDKVLTIQNQLSKISELNAKKKIASRLFDVVGATIPPEPNTVRLSSLSLDTANSRLVLEGQAANGYPALEIFKKTVDGAVVRFMQNDAEQEVKLATNISTSDISDGQDASGARVLRFTLAFTYPIELFAPAAEDLRIAITVQGNVTDSYLGVPKSLFTQRATDVGGEN